MEIKDYYILIENENNDVISLCKFNHHLTYSQILEIQRKIEDIKEQIEEWQYANIVEELHNYFDFEECYIDSITI